MLSVCEGWRTVTIQLFHVLTKHTNKNRSLAPLPCDGQLLKLAGRDEHQAVVNIHIVLCHDEPACTLT